VVWRRRRLCWCDGGSDPGAELFSGRLAIRWWRKKALAVMLPGKKTKTLMTATGPLAAHQTADSHFSASSTGRCCVW